MSDGQETTTRRLSRPRDNRWLAGVCSGLARRFGLRPNLVRLLFVLSCLLPGPQLIIYLMLWAIIPSAPKQSI
jgi:phage shock protein PspC (stress-responsive transcriptional regulator)